MDIGGSSVGQSFNIPAFVIREDLSGMSRKDHAEYQASEKGYVIGVANAIGDSLVREAELKELLAAERKAREYLEANHKVRLEKCNNVIVSYRDLPGTHPNGYTGQQYAEVLFDDGHSRKNFVSRRREVIGVIQNNSVEAEADLEVEAVNPEVVNKA